MNEGKVQPDSPGGFRDYLPAQMQVRQRMLATIRNVFERFGFDPLETAAMEYWDVLTGDDPDFDMVLYKTKRSCSERLTAGRRETALRFDLTVPLARVMAKYPELPRPFKRHQCGDVWRGEKPQVGRYREFKQFDADSVGTSSMVADAEIVWLMCETMRALGVERFRVRFNNRKVSNGLPAYAGFPEENIADVLRVLDKLDKIGIETVVTQLTAPLRPESTDKEGQAMASTESESEDSDDDTPAVEDVAQTVVYGLGLAPQVAARIREFLEVTGTTEEILDQADIMARGIPIMQEGIVELREMVGYLRAARVPEEFWGVDLAVTRGLAYYTGPVFETVLTDLPNIGSVFSGGRYDNLVKRFLPDSIPATGASIGVDRLFAALEQLGMADAAPTMVQALVTVMDPTLMNEYIGMVRDLREAGVRTAIYFGEEMAFKAQMAFATSQEIPVVVICGTREMADGTVQVRDMRARTQEAVPRASLTERVRSLFS